MTSYDVEIPKSKFLLFLEAFLERFFMRREVLEVFLHDMTSVQAKREKTTDNSRELFK